jgi:hypothetical protein
MFCSQCGKEAGPNQAFCTQCGQRLAVIPPVQQAYQAPVQQAYRPPVPQAYQPSAQQDYQPSAQQPYAGQPAAAAVADQVVWVVSTTRHFSMFKVMPCSVVFMRDKVVLAHLSPDLQKAESARVSQDIKANGTGFFNGSAAMMRYWADFYKHYYTMPTQAILAEDPLNQVIGYNAVSEVLFRCFSETISTDDSNNSVTQGKLHLSLTNGETIKLTHALGHANSIRDTLTSLFGNRLKYKR